MSLVLTEDELDAASSVGDIGPRMNCKFDLLYVVVNSTPSAIFEHAVPSGTPAVCPNTPIPAQKSLFVPVLVLCANDFQESKSGA